MDYSARWCIEPGFKIIEYQLIFHYRGHSSATSLRCFTIHMIIFNSYRVAQIKHVASDRPSGWLPFDEIIPRCCCRFTAQERQGFTAKS